MADPATPLRIWLVCVGEYLPTDPGSERKLRMSLLAETLHRRGHDVTWWVSTYDHEAKRQRFQGHRSQAVAPGYRLEFLHGRAYRRNVSLDRFRNHSDLARDFRHHSPGQQAPDLIVATVPTVELAAAAGEYARARGIPFVVDVRDQHPDIYLSLVPPVLRGPARLALAPLYRSLRTALASATAITATSEMFSRWALGYAGRARGGLDGVFPLAYPELHVAAPDREAAGAELRRAGVNPTRRVVWYVGTFNRWIDLGTPLRAARLLASRGHPDIQFVLSGDGDHAAEWRELATGLPNVVFTGWIREPGIAYLREVAWAGLAPYRVGFTTMGNKLFEFMSGGLPILFSLEHEPKRVLEELGAGLYYQAGDPGGLAAAIARLAEEPGLHARISTSGRAAYESRFRADVVYVSMAERLEIVAGTPRRTAP